MPADPTPQQKAALLVALGKLTVEQMAHEIGVSRRTLTTWKGQKAFQHLVADAKAALREKKPTTSLGNSAYRIRKLTSLHNRMWKTVIARGESELMATVPGGEYGLVTVTYKMRALGEGESVEVPEYKIDCGVSAEIRAILADAAAEVGDRKIKREISVSAPDGGPVRTSLTVRFVDTTAPDIPPDPPAEPATP